MCDTLVVLPALSATREVVFAKNSDREPNEAQFIERIPRSQPKEAMVACTFIRVPQVGQTYEVLLSRPFQMWGGEIGVNEHGVAIGNEAVFTREKIRRKNDGLTGMDLLRLALERSATAEEALQWITQLLETHGQDACGGYQNKRFFYHNSFLIADPGEAWQLETAGRHWVARRVEQAASISNALTIGTDYDRHSVSVDPEINFRRTFSDWFYTRMGRARHRQACTRDAIGPKFTPEQAMRVLATHHKPEVIYQPQRANTGSVCMHATGLTNPSQTTSSMVAVLRPKGQSTVWFTGTSRPCQSVFLPYYFGGTTLTPGPDWPRPPARPDRSYWWTAEQLFRRQEGAGHDIMTAYGEQQALRQRELLLAEKTRLEANRDGAWGDAQISRPELRRQFLFWATQLVQREAMGSIRTTLPRWYRRFQERRDMEVGLELN